MPVIEHETRALAFKPRTIDEKNRTVELIASTGAGVQRADMEGPFLEVLDLSSSAADLGRVDGMPVLDSHRQDGLDKVLGVVHDVRMDAGQLIVTVQISERADGVWRDISAGIIRNVSIGYGVDDFEDRIDQATGQRVRTVTRWTLFEISLVPVGADAGAKIRGQNMPDAPTATEPATPPVAPAQPKRSEINIEIRNLAKTFNLGDTFANDLVDREATIEDARAAALEAMSQPQTRTMAIAPRIEVGFSNDDPAELVTRMGEALYLRVNPSHKISEPAQIYAGLTMLDMAREVMRVRGISTTGLTPSDTIKRALHTTSDFPDIFADTANRTMRAAHEAAPATLRAAARQTTARDFRAKTKINLGEAPTLEKVNEHGEYKYGTMAEAKESYAIDTFGKIIGLTRKAIINDDLGAFTDLAGKMGMAAAEFEAQFMVDLLEFGSGNGPTMDDTKALFHADHGNKAGTGAAPDETTLSAARLAMRKQTGLSGKPINVAPKFLLVPPELETSAEKLLATIQANTTADVNPFGGKFDLLVEARLSSTTRWYVIGDPAQIEGLEFAYLAGEEGPQTETRAGFEVDGVEVKVRLDFGAAFLDWRAWYVNAGA